MPTIDIAIATYNGERYISEQIASILTCSIDMPGFSLGSIIVSDNKSTDGTAAIVEALAKHDARIKLVVCDSPGVINNFNFALQRTSAEYIMLCDQDDFWLKNKIQLSLEKIIELELEVGKNSPLLVFSDLSVTDSELNVTEPSFFVAQRLKPNSYLYPKHIFLANVAPGCTMMFNRKLLDMALPIPTTAAMHDWWLLLIASTFGRVAHLNVPTILYRQHANNQVGAPSKRYRTVLLSPFRQLQMAGVRLGKSSQQARVFREKFPEFPQRYGEAINFMADFGNMSKIKRVTGLLTKKIEHVTPARKAAMLVLALFMPSR